MAQIRLAANAIAASEIGHLQLVYVDGTSQLEIEVQAPAVWSIPIGGKWQYPEVRDHPANTPSYEFPLLYESVALDLGGRNAKDVWDILVDLHSDFGLLGRGIDYDVSKNSNSYANTLLYAVGIELENYIGQVNYNGIFPGPFFPGNNTNVLTDSPQDAISLSVKGSSQYDIINAGLADDQLSAGAGDDMLLGHGGSDIIDGAEGVDTSVYRGNYSEYEFSFNEDGTVGILDKAVNRDGLDSLIGVEFADFADRTVNIAGGQDISLLIDISGSMADDIASVRARAADIVNGIFENSPNSRISIITFNTIGEIYTVLSFTDHPFVEDRKQAALTGIARVQVSDGGAEPAYGAMLSALRGDAGAFRTGSEYGRRIVVFTDEPAADPELRAEVIARARGLDVDVGARGVSATSGVGRSEAGAADAAQGGSNETQIFTVFIGNDSRARAEYQELAEETGGQVFNAANASQVVDALLDAITLPQYTIEWAQISILEGNSGVHTVSFTISRDDANDAVSIDLVRSGSASDVDTGGIPLTIQLAVGEFQKTVSIDIVGDLSQEGDESLSLAIASISGPGSFSTNGATLQILNDDGPSPDQNATNGDDTLVGTLLNDALNGLGGNDVIAGMGGHDDLRGGLGNDHINGGGGDDQLIGGAGDDELKGSTGDDLLVGGAGQDRLNGGGGNDTVQGGVDDDLIAGGLGDDRIFGGAGSDRVFGGSGSDKFFFDAVDGIGRDIIGDFELGLDLIVLRGASLIGIEDHASGAELRFGNGSSVLLRDVNAADLTQSSFSYQQGAVDQYFV